MAAPLTALLTVLALVCFAANSLLARIGLGMSSGDPVLFTWVRISAGALCLVLLTRGTGRPRDLRRSSLQAAALVVYALPFSIAFRQLSTATGALIAFSSVQITMVGGAIWRGERPQLRELIGLTGATAGLILLVAPGLRAPDPVAALVMALSGVGWGVFSLLGKSAGPPLRAMTASFVIAGAFMTPWAAFRFLTDTLQGRALLCALISGAVTSGLGYVVWYRVLQQLPATRAALAQLAVPILAGAGGVLALDEQLSPRLLIATVIIVPSLAFGLTGRRVPKPTPSSPLADSTPNVTPSAAPTKHLT